MNFSGGICVLFLLITSTLSSCSDCSQKDIARAKSPTGEIEAVLLAETCGGAAGSVAYELYVVMSGKSGRFTNKERVLTVTHLKGQRLYWRNPSTVEMEYESGQIHSFVNFIHISNAGGPLEIEVILNRKRN